MTMQMFKWGRSFGVRIPDEVLKSAGLKLGDEIDVRAENGIILVEKAGRAKLPDPRGEP